MMYFIAVAAQDEHRLLHIHKHQSIYNLVIYMMIFIRIGWIMRRQVMNEESSEILTVPQPTTALQMQILQNIFTLFSRRSFQHQTRLLTNVFTNVDFRVAVALFPDPLASEFVDGESDGLASPDAMIDSILDLFV
jgi:hypothetical protein